MMPRDEVHTEARGWIAAVERAAASKAGAPLEGFPAEVAEAVGVLCMFAARARDRGNALGADAFLVEHVERMARIVGLTMDDLRALRPVGVA